MNTLKHLAIIMDGNGRWAERRGLSRTRGHIAGARRAFELIESLARSSTSLGLETVTLFGFSTENWSRPESEVTSLMRIFAHSLRSRTSFFA
jgi:undecaprenyl diphosphate synthase